MTELEKKHLSKKFDKLEAEMETPYALYLEGYKSGLFDALEEIKNLKATKMSEYKFYFGSDTVDYYVNFQDRNGWASTAMRIYEYVADECDYDGKTDMRAVYLDLLTQVEDKIRKIWNT